MALDILYTYPEDSGTYMCKATNAAGEAVTTCQVTVEGKPESPPVSRSVRTTVDSIEGRGDVSGEGRAAVGEGLGGGVEGAQRLLCVDGERDDRGMTRDGTDTATEQRTSSTLTNAYSSSGTNQQQQSRQSQTQQRLNATTGVYYPFYNAECTYVERAKMPAPQEKIIDSAESKTTSKSSVSKTSTVKSSSDFFTSTWDDDQPFPVPVAFNMRDLSLDQFKTMNEFFSGASIANPDYFDKKDTKHHESESKSWKEGNTEYHRSTTKTEMTSFTTSKKTIVTEIPSGTAAPVQPKPPVHDKRSTSQTRESKSFSRKTEKLMRESSEHQPRATARTGDAGAVQRRSQSLQRSSYRTSSGRSRSADGERIIPIETDIDSREKVDQVPSPDRTVPVPGFDNQTKTTESRESKFMRVATSHDEKQPQNVWKPVESKVPAFATKAKDNKSQAYSTKTYQERHTEMKPLMTSEPTTESDLTTKTESTHTLLKNVSTTIQTDKIDNELPEHHKKVVPIIKPYRKLRSRSVEHIPSPEEAPVVRQPRRPRSARRSEPYVTPSVKAPTFISAKPLRKASPSPVRAGPKPFTPVVYSDVVDERAIKTREWTAKDILKPVVFQPLPPRPTDVQISSEEHEELTSVSHTTATEAGKDIITSPAVCATYAKVTDVSAPYQTEKQKRMEETFVKKVVDHQEHKEIPDLPEPPKVQQPQSTEMTEPQKLSTLETRREYKTLTTTTQQQEIPKVLTPVPSAPEWHEPVQTPKAAQTEQQRRMEKKFIKKVIERKESKELPIMPTPEATTIYDIPQPLHPPPPQVQESPVVREVRGPAMALEPVHRSEVKEAPSSAPPKATDEHQFYERKVCESKTVTMATQQETLPPPAEPITAVWHKPVQAPKVPQTEREKRMEEKFISKVIQHQEAKEIATGLGEVMDEPKLAPICKPQPMTPEITAEHKFSTQETNESKTSMTIIQQQETQPVPVPIPNTPVWQEPVHTPKAAQTEQQKRMEEKFLKKVTVREESEELPAPEAASTSAECKTVPISEQEPVTTTVIDQKSSCVTEIRKFQKTVTTQNEELVQHVPEPTAPVWHEPALAPKTLQTEQQKRLEENFIRKVSDHETPEEGTDLPEPPPAPSHEVLYPVEHAITKPLKNITPKPFQPVVADEQQSFSQAAHEEKTVTMTRELREPPVAPAPVLIKPIRHEPIQTPKAPQTEQQKRMEEKFMKKLTEKQQSKDTPDTQEPVLPLEPAPVYDIPRPYQHPPPETPQVPDVHVPVQKPEPASESTERQGCYTQEFHEFKTMTTQQETTPAIEQPVPIIPIWHEPEQSPKVPQTEQQKRMEEKFMKKIVEKQESKHIAEEPLPVPEPVPAPIYDTPRPIQQAAPRPEEPVAYVPVQEPQLMSEITKQQTHYTQEFHESKTMTVTTQQETTPDIPSLVPITPTWHEPEQTPKASQTEQQKRMEEKFMKKVIEHQESSAIPERIDAFPVSEPPVIPVKETDQQQSYSHEVHESKKTSSVIQEEETPKLSEQFTPIWHEPAQTPKVAQTEQQKLMEDKFVKKVIQHQEAKVMPDKPEPIPVTETPESLGCYTQEFHKYRTMTTTQQETTPAIEHPVPIIPTWHEPEQAPKALQTEQQKRMEEKFIKKIVEKQEAKHIEEEHLPVPEPMLTPIYDTPRPIQQAAPQPEKPAANIPDQEPQPMSESTNQQTSYTQEFHESKKMTVTTQQETTPDIPSLVPITPTWHEPEQTPKAPQTEQQKRMEEKFMKKVIEHQESSAILERIDAIPVPEPPVIPVEETDQQQSYSHEVHESKKTSSVLQEEETPKLPEQFTPIWHEPAQTPKVAQTEQQKRMEEKFVKKVIQHQEAKEMPDKPEPIPVTETPESMGCYTQEFHEYKTMTTTQQETTPAIEQPVPIIPIWHEPEQSPKVPQTEQQKRMEEKFMKKIVEKQESKHVTEEPLPVPEPVLAPIYDTPRPIQQAAPQPEKPAAHIPDQEPQPMSESTEQQSFYTQEFHESKTMTVTIQQETTPDIPSLVPITPTWHEPEQTPKTPQTEQQKRMEEKFMKKVIEHQESSAIPERIVTVDVPEPPVIPVEETDQQQSYSHEVHESKKTSSVTQEEEMPKLPEQFTPIWHEPAQTPKVAQTEQQKLMEEKFVNKVIQHQEAKEMPDKPEPIPVTETPESMGCYTQEFHEIKTMTTTEQETTPAVEHPVPIIPIWHEPEQSTKVPQTEQQKRMEEKFMKKIVEKQESKHIADEPLPVPESAPAPIYDTPRPIQQAAPQPEKPAAHIPDQEPQPMSESTEQQSFYTQEFHESKTMTVTTQQETTPDIPSLVPITPTWHEPEQTPKASQTEQQKRMEEKFMKKVIEHQEPSAIPERIDTVLVPEPPVIPVEETDHQQSYSHEVHESKKTSSVIKEEKTPKLPEQITPIWHEPAQAPIAAQTEQQKRMEEKFIKKVTQHQEAKEMPDKPEPIPVTETPESMGCYTQEFHEYKTMTTTQQETTPAVEQPVPIIPIWHEPEQSPKVPQTEQQKRMEEKFMKKIVEKQESKHIAEEPLPLPEPVLAPIYDTPRPIQQAAPRLEEPVAYVPVQEPQLMSESTKQQTSYTQEFHESKTMTVTTQQETTPDIPSLVPITPTWHEPEQTPKTPQTEQQKRMEEKFIKKVIEHQESSAIPERIVTVDVPEPPVIVEETDQQQSYSHEVHESKKTSSVIKEEETPKLPEQITPIWHEPAQAPIAAQTEQQKRMEEKFIKKVTQHQESKEMPDKPEPITIPETQPAETEQTSEMTYTREVREFTVTTVEQEIQPTSASKPVQEPPFKSVVAPKASQTEQLKQMEGKVFRKVSEQKDCKELPIAHEPIVPPTFETQPQPVDIADDQTSFKRQTHEFKTITVTAQEQEQPPVPAPVPITPIWHEPVQTSKAAQTEQQKRMEKKFMQKVIEHKESKAIADSSEAPIYDAPRPIVPPIPQAQETVVQSFSDSYEKEFTTSEIAEQQNICTQDIRETAKTSTTSQETRSPAEKVQPAWVEPMETPKVAQTAQQKRMEEKFMKRVIEHQEPKDVPDLSELPAVPVYELPRPTPQPPQPEETTQTHTSRYQSWHETSKSVETPQPPSVTGTIHMPTTGDLPPKPDTALSKGKKLMRPLRERERKTSYHDTSMSDFSDSEIKIKEIESKPLQTETYESYTNKFFTGPKVQEPPIYHKIHIEGHEDRKKENIYETIIPFPTLFKPAPEPQAATTTTKEASPAATTAVEPVTESPLTAIRHVDSPRPVRKQVRMATPEVAYPFQNGDAPLVSSDIPRTEQQASHTPSVQKQSTEPVPVQEKKMKKEEKLMRKYDDIVKRTKQTTREEEKRVFSPSPAPAERADIPASRIGEFSESKQISSRTGSMQVPEAPKPTPKPALTQTTSGVKSTLEKLEKQTKSDEIAGQPAPIFRSPTESKQQKQLSQTFESTMTAQFSSAWQTPAPAAGPGPVARPSVVPAREPHKHLTTGHATDESRKREVIAKISSQQRDEARAVAVGPVPEPRELRQESTRRTEQTESSRRVSEQTVKSTDTVRPEPVPPPVQPPAPPPRTDSSERRETSRLFSEKKTVSDSYQAQTAAPRAMEVLPQPQREPQTPQGMPEPYVDRQETFSSSKSDEKTATGHRQSESAEKKSHEVLHSVTNLPGSSTTRTMQQSSFQTMSQSFETSEQTFPAFPAPQAIEFPPLLPPQPFSEQWSSLDQSTSWNDMADISSSLDEQFMQQSFLEPQITPASMQSWKMTEKSQTGQTSKSCQQTELIIPIELPPETGMTIPKQAKASEKEQTHQIGRDMWQENTPKSTPSTPGVPYRTVDSSSHFEHQQTGSRQTVDGRERIIPITSESSFSRPIQPFVKTPEQEQRTMTSQSFNRFETTTQQSSEAPRESLVPVQLTSQNLQEHTQNLSGATSATSSWKPTMSQRQQQQHQKKWLDEQIQQSSHTATKPVVTPTHQKTSESLSHQSKFEKSTTSSGHEHAIPMAVTPAFAPRAVQKQSDAISRSVLDSSMKTSVSAFDASPYVDRQETSSRSKSRESTADVTKDTESSERSMYSVQRSGPQTVPGPTPGSSVTQSSSEVRHEMSQSHTEHTSGRRPQVPVSQPRTALPLATSEAKQPAFLTKSANASTHWGPQPTTSNGTHTSQLGSSKSTTEASRKDVSKTDQASRWGSGRGPASLGPATAPKSESSFIEKHTKDGKNEHYQSLGYTSGSDVERIEEENRSIRREKENMNAKKVDNKTEVFETEEMRPDGRYRIQKTVETKTEEELTQNKHTETTTETLPAIGR